MRQSKTVRVAALMTAPIWQPASRAYEVATANVDSIRWSIPGLDNFMRVMAPIWGFDVSPLHALLAAMAMAVALTMIISAALQQAYLERLRQPQPAPLRISTLPARNAPPDSFFERGQDIGYRKGQTLVRCSA